MDENARRAEQGAHVLHVRVTDRRLPESTYRELLALLGMSRRWSSRSRRLRRRAAVRTEEDRCLGACPPVITTVRDPA
ncbi:hypothetical protein SAMN05216252_113148 [Actinacidiphila glaucinigra]|uniref:Uncharacterized protein n=1 Tax=Actinacidiphila glaucinigra TaxID=235986 RepID=A0A239JSN6_9ACTN|nr:hypothetical protein SAMN05216252_113148 [Actinacidiphila glaucinigra]